MGGIIACRKFHPVIHRLLFTAWGPFPDDRSQDRAPPRCRPPPGAGPCLGRGGGGGEESAVERAADHPLAHGPAGRRGDPWAAFPPPPPPARLLGENRRRAPPPRRPPSARPPAH